MSIRQLCSTFQVNRRWFYSRLAHSESVDPDVELRDATLADHSGVCWLWVSASDACIGASWLECES
jgi:hypothetical protein